MLIIAVDIQFLWMSPTPVIIHFRLRFYHFLPDPPSPHLLDVINVWFYTEIALLEGDWSRIFYIADRALSSPHPLATLTCLKAQWTVWIPHVPISSSFFWLLPLRCSLMTSRNLKFTLVSSDDI